MANGGDQIINGEMSSTRGITASEDDYSYGAVDYNPNARFDGEEREKEYDPYTQFAGYGTDTEYSPNAWFYGEEKETESSAAIGYDDNNGGEEVEPNEATKEDAERTPRAALAQLQRNDSNQLFGGYTTGEETLYDLAKHEENEDNDDTPRPHYITPVRSRISMRPEEFGFEERPSLQASLLNSSVDTEQVQANQEENVAEYLPQDAIPNDLQAYDEQSGPMINQNAGRTYGQHDDYLDTFYDLQMNLIPIWLDSSRIGQVPADFFVTLDDYNASYWRGHIRQEVIDADVVSGLFPPSFIPASFLPYGGWTNEEEIE